MDKQKLLIVDDEETILKQLQWAYQEDFEIVTARTEADALAAVEHALPELMILDLSLTQDTEHLEGFQVLEAALERIPLLKVIVITGHGEKENALQAIQKGAYDFYVKPVAVDELRVMLKRASYLHTLESELEQLRHGVGEMGEFENIIALSGEMGSVFETIKRVAPTDVSVLVTGESGTGKELVARAIHNRSPRCGHPFVPINCGAIPENLLESELFGHEKGSFTGAHESRPGKFEIADGGTIFLDEIGELTPPLQVKLLRFLQDQVIERVGGREPIQVNVRIIAATNRDLQKMLGDKSFREDLFYRINTLRISLPPLRHRGEDIELLAMFFLHRYTREFSKSIRGFNETAIKKIHTYSWPGNVRELENRVKRAVIMATGKVIRARDLDLERPRTRTLKDARDELERSLIVDALLFSEGNISAAAKALDISRPTMHDLMKKHGIKPEKFKDLRDKR